MVESAWANIGFFFYQLDPEVRRLVRRLECFHLNIFKKKQSAVFNQTCLDNDLLPQYTTYVCIYIYIYIYVSKQNIALDKSLGLMCHISQPSQLEIFKSNPERRTLAKHFSSYKTKN